MGGWHTGAHGCTSLVEPCLSQGRKEAEGCRWKDRRVHCHANQSAARLSWSVAVKTDRGSLGRPCTLLLVTVLQWKYS